ncbi:Tetratricopeptide repeat protein 4 [Geodia barretti]|uniref:Tetratricopeptide repeat protein 4 n=1 Tax=Geodia barretti TaxID=519541 RepID=A0AA35WMS1_GEOBA|nr:Tetratricopeptide repeat protein 4 [Geodia barretti]
MATGALSPSTAEGKEAPRVADFDELVDEVLAKKGPSKYTDGLSEDNWEEELEKIPLFMTRAPTEIDPQSAPALAALQDLIYQEDTPKSRALAHKEDGNEHFRKKRYRQAVETYSAAINQGCKDRELRAILFCNRATSQYRLGNFRSALADAGEAHRSNDEYMKAIVRASECCVRLKRFSEALKWCEIGLTLEDKNPVLKQLRVTATTEKKKQERDKRREEAATRAKSQRDTELVQIIKSRGVSLHLSVERPVDLTSPHPAGARVHLTPDGTLVWPVLLLYPEYGTSDYIAEFREHDRFIDHLTEMFKTPAPWDVEGKYPLQALQLYYRDVHSMELWRVDPHETLGFILKRKSYVVSSGTPELFVLSSLSAYTPHFLGKTEK